MVSVPPPKRAWTRPRPQDLDPEPQSLNVVSSSQTSALKDPILAGLVKAPERRKKVPERRRMKAVRREDAAVQERMRRFSRKAVPEAVC